MGMEKSSKRWITLLAICIAGGVIFKLAYLRDVFYVPMGEAFNVTNTELGWMMSAYAVTQTLSAIPGGWLVDAVPVKILVPLSLISTGLLGFWLASYPPFWVVLLIQVLFGITINLLFWEAMIKGVRMLGDHKEQGKLFGLLEGGRGLFATMISFLALYVFSAFGEGKMGLRATMITYGAVLTALGFLTYFLIEKNEVEEKINPREALKGLVQVSKYPKVWVAGFIVFFGYGFYNGLSYLTPFLTDEFGISVKTGVALSIIRTYLIAFIAGPIAGVVADKMGSSIKFLKVALLMGAILTGLYLVIPIGDNSLYAMIALMLVLATVVMFIHATYYSTTSEMNIPIAMAGSAAGILSLLGNAPDLFIFTVYGHFLDRYPGLLGYKLVFIVMIAFALLGMGSCILLLSMLKKEKRGGLKNEVSA